MYGSGLPLIGCAELCVDIVGAASDRDDLDLLENCLRRAEPVVSSHQGDSALAVSNRRFGVVRHVAGDPGELGGRSADKQHPAALSLDLC